MRKRLLKKYLSFFGLTLKVEQHIDAASGRVIKEGEACFGPKRRYGLQSYLPPAHPLARRRKDREGRQWARVLPALLKADIGDAAKRYCSGRVDEIRYVREHEAGDAPVWVEQGSKPRLRLYSAARRYVNTPDYTGDLSAYRAAVGRVFSALFRERPQVIGKRLQSGNRVKLAGCGDGPAPALTTNPTTPTPSGSTP